MTAHVSDLRIGLIGFLNTLPLRHSFPQLLEELRIPATLTVGTPAELNAKLLGGELDIATSSSLTYLRNKSLSKMRGFAISCRGPVQSVLFVSKHPISKLAASGKPIFVTDASETSVAVLSYFLSRETKSGITFRKYHSTQWKSVLKEEGNALLIGNAALSFLVSNERSSFHVMDLGENWSNQLKVPLVFGLLTHGTVDKKWLKQLEKLANALPGHVRHNLNDTRALQQSLENEKTTGHWPDSLTDEQARQYLQKSLNFETKPDLELGLEKLQELVVPNAAI